MLDSNKFIELESLNIIARSKLIEYGFLSSHTQTTLTPNYSVILNGTKYSHYIITCSNSAVKFFLKLSKGNDNSLHCNEFLKIFRNNDEYAYPIILVPEFKYKSVNYYITTYTEGNNLDTLSSSLTKNEWKKISHELRKQLDNLSTIKATMYSEKNQFLNIGCADILKNKFQKRLNHVVFGQFDPTSIMKAYDRSCEILNHCQFSDPTLLHMDVKPANVIYNPQTRTVKLIDFEFARFGDWDFGWTQILLTKCNFFSKEYKEYMFPYLTEGRLTLDEALTIPKYKCYLFYQTACNLIYYFDKKQECPQEMYQLFMDLLNCLSQE
ncbi:MAG: hypothetical protein IJZ29_01335 [Clostridia bacterium]|nr:hypothetical protein [Clostridia bacterium]